MPSRRTTTWISVNSAIQVDMMGQICSESMGPIQYTGTGGAADFAIGANHAKGGKSITRYPLRLPRRARDLYPSSPNTTLLHQFHHNDD
ncbi:MAG: acetyl-CoA hydrolase/transferase C-terminal domain-containing protein [Oscillospiraceae bacterium]